jgi:hypothetical protein
MSVDLDVAATTVRSLRMAMLGAGVPLPPAALDVAKRHADLISVLDDDHRVDVAPAMRGEEPAEPRHRSTDYHARLLADPKTTMVSAGGA